MKNPINSFNSFNSNSNSKNISLFSYSNILYNSLNPHFSLILFFEQLFIHIFFPLPLPYFYWKYGLTFLYAHGYYPIYSTNILNWLFPISVQLTILSGQYLPHNIGGGYFVPTCILLLHRFMVAMKYGTISQSEYS